jgi:acyl-coenzyme A synthetase/AMP-(fatty) acid ligase
VPDVIKVVETLPRLDNGKSDRMALAAQAAELAAL